MPFTDPKTRLQDRPQPMPVEKGPAELPSNPRAKFYQHLNLFWDSRRVLAKAALIGVVIGLLIAFLIPARYESTAELMPPDNQSGSGLAMLAALTSKSGTSGLGAIAGDLLGVKSSGALFVGVLGSKTVQDRISERFNLKRVYSVKLEEDARKQLANNTALAEDRKSGIISITVTDRDPARASAISQAYINELNELIVQLSTSAAHRERMFLEERLQSVKRDLDQASVKFSQFSSKNATIDIKEQGRAMVEAASILQGQLIAAQSELKGLEEIYTPTNFRVRAVQARISELSAQLNKLGGNGFGDANQKNDASASLYPSIRQLPLLGVTYADLYRQTKIQEVVFETLTQQYELAKVQEAKEIPSIKVLDSPRVPEQKSFPPRFLIMFSISVLFLSVAMVIVYIQQRWKQASANDPGKLLAQDVLQTINNWVILGTAGGSGLLGLKRKSLGRDKGPGD